MNPVSLHISQAVVAVGAVLGSFVSAVAHPHVLPNIQVDIVFNPQGEVKAVRQSWEYDSAYSLFVSRDLDANRDGIITSAELTVFANGQIDALAENNYFTRLFSEGRNLKIEPPTAFGADRLADGRLRLNFEISIEAPLTPNKEFVVEIYDPNFFAYFTLSKADGVRLIGAPATCASVTAGPQPIDLKQTKGIPAVFWRALDGSSEAGLQFVNRITVKCQ